VRSSSCWPRRGFRAARWSPRRASPPPLSTFVSARSSVTPRQTHGSAAFVSTVFLTGNTTGNAMETTRFLDVRYRRRSFARSACSFEFSEV
jgi:hypothetical protein